MFDDNEAVKLFKLNLFSHRKNEEYYNNITVSNICKDADFKFVREILQNSIKENMNKTRSCRSTLEEISEIIKLNGNKSDKKYLQPMGRQENYPINAENYHQEIKLYQAYRN